MKRILTLTIAALFSLSLTLPAWAIEREKKGQSSQSEQKPIAVEAEKKKAGTPEIAPPKEEKKQTQREPESTPTEKTEEKKVEKPVTTETEKIKFPPLERKLINEVDRFVDKNGNGIDDRLEASQQQPDKPKPPEKKKKKKD